MRARPDQPPLIGEIRIEGNSALSDKDILEKISLTESGRRILGVFDSGDRNAFAPELLRADAKRIERLYRANGYYQAKVTFEEPAPEEGRVDLVFNVAEGPPVRLEKLAIDGLEALTAKEREELLRGLPLKEGDVFVEGTWDDLKGRLQSRLRELGRAEATVDGTVEVNPVTRAATASVQLAAGAVYRIERVYVFGAQTVSRGRIVDAAELEAGDLLTPKNLAEAQRRVYALGVFSLVQLDLGVFNRKGGTVPVVVTVSEAPFVTLEAAAGIEIDPGRQLARLRARGLHRNLLGGLQRLNLTGSIGYAFVPSLGSHLFDNASADQRGFVGDLGAEFTVPRVRRSPVDVVVGADFTHDLTPAFRYTRYGGRLSFPVRFDGLRELTLIPSLNYELYLDVRPGGGTSTIVIDPSRNACGPGTTGIDPDNCNLFYGELRATWDGRDDLVTPRKGIYASVGLQYSGGPAWLSDFSYFRLLPELRGYVPVSREVTLAARVRAGLVNRTGGLYDLPGIALFFAGGANSVRTAGAQQLGPRNFSLLQGTENGLPTLRAGVPVPTGGDRLLEASLELRWDTGFEVGPGTVGVVGFVDAGRVSRGTDSVFQLGPGVGLRYYTSYIGAVRIDVAYRIAGQMQTPTDVIPDPATVPGADPDKGAYVIQVGCPTKNDYRCYEDSSLFGTLQVFLTLGEAF